MEGSAALWKPRPYECQSLSFKSCRALPASIFPSYSETMTTSMTTTASHQAPIRAASWTNTLRYSSMIFTAPSNPFYYLLKSCSRWPSLCAGQTLILIEILRIGRMTRAMTMMVLSTVDASARMKKFWRSWWATTTVDLCKLFLFAGPQLLFTCPFGWIAYTAEAQDTVRVLCPHRRDSCGPLLRYYTSIWQDWHVCT